MTEWRAIPGWSGYYEVSDDGQVRSLDRTVEFVSRWGTVGHRRFPGRTLKLTTLFTGYHQVELNAGEGRVTRDLVHRLVLAAFVGPCPDGQEVRHLNGIRDDNKLLNLTYGTHSENQRDQALHGTNHNLNKTRCPRRHALIPPNLAGRRLPERICLACAKAFSARWKIKPTAEQFAAAADYYYGRIMGPALAVASRRDAAQGPSQAPAQRGPLPDTHPVRDSAATVGRAR